MEDETKSKTYSTNEQNYFSYTQSNMNRLSLTRNRPETEGFYFLFKKYYNVLYSYFFSFFILKNLPHSNLNKNLILYKQFIIK